VTLCHRVQGVAPGRKGVLSVIACGRVARLARTAA
jgi:hypothetical protein